MSNTITITQKIEYALQFGEPAGEGFETDSESITHGGWINIAVPVAVNDKAIGTAHIGAWVYTDHEEVIGQSQDVHDECKRSGFAIRSYEGNDRRFEPVESIVPWQTFFALSDEEVETDEYAALDIESLILDEAESHATGFRGVDYEELFTEALREKLQDTDGYYVYALMQAVRALEGK